MGIAYRPHRRNNNYMPEGFSAIASKWDNLCSYTANANGNYALCNIPINTHAWRHPGQYNPGFMCGKPAKACKATQVANSDKASAGSITGSAGDGVKVTCKSGFAGSGVAYCKSDGQFTTVTCKKAGTCKATQVAYSNYAKSGSISGGEGKTVTIKCSSGYVGGGKMVCDGKKSVFEWDVGKACVKAKSCAAFQIANSNYAKSGSMKGVENGVNGRTEIKVTCNTGYKMANGESSGISSCGIPKAGKFTPLTCSKGGSSKCTGDVDGNKKVNIEDLLVLLGEYGKTGSGLKADLDANKKVNIEDLLILLGKYGSRC